jgi:hypothetical protein
MKLASDHQSDNTHPKKRQDHNLQKIYPTAKIRPTVQTHASIAIVANFTTGTAGKSYNG